MKYILCLLIFLMSSCPTLAAVYLDGSTTGCSEGSTNYSPATRSCGGGSDTVSLTLADFNTRMVAGATNYMRAGNYYRTSGSAYQGALRIVYAKSGTSGAYTIVKAYTGEERQVVIATASNRFNYNSAPDSAASAGSYAYYPCPAVGIESNYTVVDGIKTYGQVVIWDSADDHVIHDSYIQNSDLGGGGPNEDQGQVVKLHSCYDIYVKNNYIHHSCFGDGNAENGSAVMGYGFSAIIENNTFENTVGSSVRLKDAAGRNSNTTRIQNNLFLPSTLDVEGEHFGVQTVTQSRELGNLYINNNIFIENGLQWTWSALTTNVAYNNTFVDCPRADIVAENEEEAYQFSTYNNVFYNTSSIFLSIGSAGVSSHLAAIDYNVYYSTASTPWYVSYESVATTLTGWKTYSSRDANSISSNPNFVNSSGTTAASFKRTSYTENFTGSSYGIYAGAYETGSEQIGYDWSTVTVLSTLSGGGKITGGTIR